MAEETSSNFGNSVSESLNLIVDGRMLSTRRNYAAIVGLYTEDFGNDHRHLVDFLDPMLTIVNGQNLSGPMIDLGSGPGNVVDYLLLKKGITSDIFAVDFVSGFCRSLSEKYKNNPNVKVVNEEFVEFIAKQPNDSVVAYTAGFSIIHIPDDKIDDLFRDITRTLKPGGLFFFSVYEGNDKGMAPEPYQEDKDPRLDVISERLEAYMNNFQSSELGKRLERVGMKKVKLVVANDGKPGEYSNSKIFGLFQKRV